MRPTLNRGGGWARIRLLVAAAAWLGAGCRGSDPPPATPAPEAPAPESPACPEGMVWVPPWSGQLGETDPSRSAPNYPLPGVLRSAVIEATPLRTEAFCVDRLPFPGLPGAPWSGDGLSLENAYQLDALLQHHGRRLCTVTELTRAAAGPENRRFAYGDAWDDSVCRKENPDTTVSGVLGEHPGCVSSLGVADFHVRSAWARLDGQARERLGEQLGHDLPNAWMAVWGGTSRLDTFYQPTNVSVPWHGAADGAHLDDGARACRDPGPVDAEVEARYRREVVDRTAREGTFRTYAFPPW
ncbi:hypothetical protein L6R50_12300 [Myxococcota bacterium]|nr:hypothetical protein [Myxococcota bacterium]